MGRKCRGCAVPGCDDKDSVRHRFPKSSDDAEVYKMWLKRINNPKLASLSKEKVYMNYMICDRHFDDDCRVARWKKLKKKSLPTLHLPNYSFKEAEEVTVKCTGQEELNSAVAVPEKPVTCADACDTDQGEDAMVTSTTPTGQQCNIVETYKKDIGTMTETVEIVKALGTKVADDDIEVTNQQSLSDKLYFKSVRGYLPATKKLSEICRICFSAIVDTTNVVKFNENVADVECETLRNMLDSVLPNLNTWLYPDIVFCPSCIELLHQSYKLKNTWLATEERLRKIVERKVGITKRGADLVIVVDKEGIVTDAENKNDNEGTDENKLVMTKRMMEDILRCKGSSKMYVSVFRGDIVANHPLPRVEMMQNPADSYCWGNGPYMCHICGELHRELKFFQLHMRSHSLAARRRRSCKKLMCEVCGTLFGDTGKLKLHSRSHVEHKCKICNRVFRFNAQLQCHIKRKHLGMANSQCHICGKQFAYKTSYRIHMLIHYPKRVHACQMCPKKFNMPSQLKRHQRKHSTQKYACEYCGRLIKHEITLAKHIKIYHKQQPDCVCDVCERPYWKKCDLVQHKIKVHGQTLGDREKSVEAESQPERPVSQELKNKDESDFICDICHRPCWERLNLIKHKVRLHGWKPNDEKECQVEVVQKDPGTEAETKHTIHHSKPTVDEESEEKSDFECDICDLPYWNKRSLIRHKIRIHDWKPEDLEDSQIAALQESPNHNQKEEPQRNVADFLECNFCKKRYWKKRNLCKHKIKVHGCQEDDLDANLYSERKDKDDIKEEPDFVCDLCSRPCWEERNLIRHKVRIHGWKPDGEKQSEEVLTSKESQVANVQKKSQEYAVYLSSILVPMDVIQ